MRLTIKAKLLAAETAALTHATDKKELVPDLGNVVMLFDGARLTMQATNYTNWLRCVLEVEGEPGTLAVNLRRLHSFVASLPDEDLSISTTESGSLRLECAGSRAVIPAESIERQPALNMLPVPERSADIEVQGTSLEDALKKAGSCIADLDGPAFSKALRITQVGASLRFVAVNQPRMAVVDIPCFGSPFSTDPVYIAKESASFLRSVIGDGAVSIWAPRDNAPLIMSNGHRQMTIVRMSCTFPNVDRVVDAWKSDAEYLLSASEFSSSVKRAAPFTDGKVPSVKIRCAGKAVEVACDTPNLGSMVDTFDAAEGEQDVEFRVNSSHLVACLSNFNAVRLSVSEQTKDGFRNVQMASVDGNSRLWLAGMGIR